MTLSRRYEGPHLDHPSRHDVEVALQALDIEDEREKALIRSFWARERLGLRLKVALLRFRAIMSKNRLYIGPVGLNLWYPFKVLAAIAFVLAVLWFAAAFD